MKPKTDYSPAEIQVIQSLLKYEGDNIEKCGASESYIVKYQCKAHQDLYFQINRTVNTTSNGVHFEVSKKPGDRNTTKPTTTTVGDKNIKGLFDVWLDFIQIYTSSINPHETLEDKFLRDSQEEIFDWFELVEEDTNTTQYDIKTQLLIDKFLSNSIHLLEEKKDGKNDEEIDVLIEEAKGIKVKQTSQAKAQVAKNVAWFMAKARKFFPDVFYDMLKDKTIEAIASFSTDTLEVIRGLLT